MESKSKRHRTLRIGVKYCGGCNPRYDRIEAVEYIRRNLPRDAVLSRWDDDDVDIILIVAGCKTACVDRSAFVDMPVRELTGMSDAKEFVEEIRRNWSQ